MTDQSTIKPVELFIDPNQAHIIKRDKTLLLIISNKGMAPVLFMRWLTCYHNKAIFRDCKDVAVNEIGKEKFEISLNTTSPIEYGSAREFINDCLSPAGDNILKRAETRIHLERLSVPMTANAVRPLLKWISGKPENYLRSVTIENAADPRFLIELAESNPDQYGAARDYINQNLTK